MNNSVRPMRGLTSKVHLFILAAILVSLLIAFLS